MGCADDPRLRYGRQGAEGKRRSWRMTTREEAIETLERGHREIRRLIKRIPPHWMARPGVGDGDWTPKDLLGHLCSWEEKVLEALAAWDAGERAPIDRDIHSRSIGAINAEGVRRRSRHTLARVQRDWDNVHGALIRAIRAMPDARWENPATPRGRKALGHRMGQLLLGAGPFAHAEAHVRDLESFVESIPEGER
jgi:Mycothiol maleylpyruvate isomerase N-terminal domain